MRLGRGSPAALAAAFALCACAPRAGDQPAAGSAAAAPGTPAAAAAPAAGPVVSAEAKAVCAAVAAWWRRDPTASVRVADSLVAPPTGDPVTGCVVVAYQAHGLRRDSLATPDTATATPGAGATLARATGKGWIELVRFMADGPDGSSSAFQRGPVRCSVAQNWDGGDDSDPSYVAEDWYEEDTICWTEPGGIAVRDTAP